MATLVLDRSHIELHSDGAALALYEAGERRGTVPLKLIERVVRQGTILLDTGVLTGLAEAGVATILLGATTSRRVAIMLGPPSHQGTLLFQATTRPSRYPAPKSRHHQDGVSDGVAKAVPENLSGTFLAVLPDAIAASMRQIDLPLAVEQRVNQRDANHLCFCPPGDRANHSRPLRREFRVDNCPGCRRPLSHQHAPDLSCAFDGYFCPLA
jgi:hypothetical protein